jgi:radical SAM enzyme (TIGR01210 family)
MLKTSEIIALRPDRNKVHPDRPYHFLHEQEMGPDGRLKEVNTIFLTNSECPFKCVMCDLWKNTSENPVDEGDVPNQITYALDRLPDASVVKLYNSGNFFDRKAIPPADYPVIADQLSDYQRVIIENHPKLCGEACVDFQQMLNGQLEIAMGLETIHPDVLPKLNKQITKNNFQKAAQFLLDNGIDSRAFILLNPPYLTDQRENIDWTIKSVEYAFECGVSSCSIIPTREGNGAMEKLRKEGHYVPPTIGALEEAFDRALKLANGRVFADLWDLEQFSDCSHCFEKRKSRLDRMNLEQQIYLRIECAYCGDE